MRCKEIFDRTLEKENLSTGFTGGRPVACSEGGQGERGEGEKKYRRDFLSGGNKGVCGTRQGRKGKWRGKAFKAGRTGRHWSLKRRRFDPESFQKKSGAGHKIRGRLQKAVPQPQGIAGRFRISQCLERSQVCAKKKKKKMRCKPSVVESS